MLIPATPSILDEKKLSLGRAFFVSNGCAGKGPSLRMQFEALRERAQPQGLARRRCAAPESSHRPRRLLMRPAGHVMGTRKHR